MDNMLNSLSIIIPVYNAQNDIEKCIISLLNQTKKDFNIIMVDDFSTDGSLSICKKYAQSDNRIQIIEKSINEGATMARTDGIRLATTEYVTFLDADDWVESNHIEEIYKILTNINVDLLAESCIYENGGEASTLKNGDYQGLYIDKEIEHVYERMLCSKEFFEFGVLPYLWNKVFRREWIMELCEKIDPSIYDGEDVGIIIPYLLKCNSIYFSDTKTYHYCVRHDSISRKRRLDFMSNCSKLYLHLYSVIEKSDYYDILRPQLDHYMRMMIHKCDEREFINSKKYYFPFSKVNKGSQVVIYGAGVVGCNYVYDILQTEFCNITNWVDKNWINMNTIYGMPIENPQVLENNGFDKIVIAILDEMIAKNVIDFLIDELGIDKEKIIFG